VSERSSERGVSERGVSERGVSERGVRYLQAHEVSPPTLALSDVCLDLHPNICE
jgi:hypothetical protein